jgi:hypothetical protein
VALFVFAIIIAVIAVLGIFGVIFTSSVPRNPKVWSIIGGVFALFLSGGLIYASMFQSVPTKSEGVVTSYGKVVGTPYGPGGHIIAPWKTLNIVQDTIQSDSFFQSNGTGADRLTTRGITGYCISVRLAGLSQGCLDVQMQSQVQATAIPELYTNYSSYGPSLTLDIDQYVVQRELKTILNRPPLSDYNVIQDVSNSLTACIKNGQSSCTANTSSQFSQFDPVVLKELQQDPQLKGKIDILDVNLQFPHFDNNTENAIQKIQYSYLETVEATQQEKTNAAISTANAALVTGKSGQSLTPAVLQYDCYQTVQSAIKANYTGLPATFSCGGGGSNVLVGGK